MYTGPHRWTDIYGRGMWRTNRCAFEEDRRQQRQIRTENRQHLERSSSVKQPIAELEAETEETVVENRRIISRNRPLRLNDDHWSSEENVSGSDYSQFDNKVSAEVVRQCTSLSNQLANINITDKSAVVPNDAEEATLVASPFIKNQAVCQICDTPLNDTIDGQTHYKTYHVCRSPLSDKTDKTDLSVLKNPDFDRHVNEICQHDLSLRSTSEIRTLLVISLIFFFRFNNPQKNRKMEK